MRACMHIVLISHDPEISRLCREILEDFHGLEWSLTLATAAECPPDADIYIWDNLPASDFPAETARRSSKHLFLVERDAAERHHHEVAGGESAVLLKPVTRGRFAIFLRLAVAALREGGAAELMDTRDRDQTADALFRANLQLQQYDQDRIHFLACAAHDFRAPLTAANGYCGLLLSEALGPLSERQKELLRRMHHSLKRLSRSAFAMFDLSVGRRVKPHPHLGRTDIRECVEQALHEIRPFAESKRISVSVRLEGDAGPLYLDRGHIEQVLINLLDNACKFTPKAGKIRIRGSESFWERRSARHFSARAVERRKRRSDDPNSYRIDICNSGPRIPRERLETIFEEYARCSGEQDLPGAGLGLAVSRTIIAAHEGRLWAENTDEGPQFSLILPLRKCELSAHNQTSNGTGTEAVTRER